MSKKRVDQINELPSSKDEDERTELLEYAQKSEFFKPNFKTILVNNNQIGLTKNQIQNQYENMEFNGNANGNNAKQITATKNQSQYENLEFNGNKIQGKINQGIISFTSQNMSTDNRPSPERERGGGGGGEAALNTTTAKSPKRASTASSNGTHSGGGFGAATSTPHVGGGNGNGNGNEDETDVIGDLVGHFGKWQLLMTLLLSLFQVPNTFHIISSVYQSAKKDFWCKRPENLQEMPVEIWRNLSHSESNCYQTLHDWSQVSSSDTTTTSVIAQLKQNANNTQVACTAWEYNIDDSYGNTWASEWDLVCNREYLLDVAETVFLLGVATGGIVSGYLSDKFGRKKMLFITAVLQTIIGLALFFADSLEVYIALRCLLGLVSVAVTYSGLILAIEYVDGKWRTIAGMYNLFPLPISYMIISGIAYLTQDYRKLQLCIGLPGVFLLLLWFVVPESPRWLLVKGRISEVSKIIKSIADFNGRQLPPNYESLLKPPVQESNGQSFIWLFQSRYLRCITICFLCIWFTINLVYYGIILNMNTFGGNVYLNSALAGLVEIPAIAIAMYIITKVGKKWLFCATLIGGGIACCCAAITEGQNDLLWLKITFLMIGKFTISAGNTIMPVYTAELYPTVIRNAGVGACNVAAGLALILTPYLSKLNRIEGHLMMIILTAWSLFGGFIVLFLPEHAQKMPEEQKF